MLVVANLVELLVGETHVAQFGQRLPGLMCTELGVHHALGLLLDEKLFWRNRLDDDLACVPGDADATCYEANLVGLTVNQLDIFFGQNHIEFVLGQVFELLLIDLFGHLPEDFSDAYPCEQCIRDDRRKYSVAIIGSEYLEVGICSADSSKLNVFLALWRKFYDAVAGCKCFEQRSLHRLDGVVDILGHILAVPIMRGFRQIAVVVIQDLLTFFRQVAGSVAGASTHVVVH